MFAGLFVPAFVCLSLHYPSMHPSITSIHLSALAEGYDVDAHVRMDKCGKLPTEVVLAPRSMAGKALFAPIDLLKNAGRLELVGVWQKSLICIDLYH